MPELRGKGEGVKGKGTDDAIDRFAERDPVLITSYLSEDPRAMLTRLKCSNAEIERGRRIGEHRNSWPDPSSDVAVRRWMAAADSAVDDVIAIAQGEGLGEELSAAVERVRVSGAPLTIGELAIDGRDLIAAGIPEGPAVGDALRRLLDLVLEDPTLNTKDRLRARLSGG